MTKISTIAKTVCGSRLFGANVPESDQDFKFVFLPSGRDILMCNPPENIQQNDKDADIDCEGFSLKRFLSMAANGQTLAVEMLFTPPHLTIFSSPIWQEIQANSDKLVSKKIGPFVGYCRAQSSKFCLKSSRFNAVCDVVREFESACDSLGNSTKIHEITPILITLAANSEHIDIQFGQEKANDNWFSCCGRQVPLTASLKRALDIYTEVLNEYGNRTRKAANMLATDWKALYHSYRVACEANEILTTGKLTLPRPEAQKLLQIRLGQLSYQEVSDLIEEESNKVENNLISTTLREEADWNWINEFVLEQHAKRARVWCV